HSPGSVAEQLQHRWLERHAYEERVDKHADREAECDDFNRRVTCGHERCEHGDHDDGGGGDDAARPDKALANCLATVAAVHEFFAYARDQEDLVVHGEPKEHTHQ